MTPEQQRIKIAEKMGWCYSPYASLEVKQDAILSWIRSGNADWQPECLPDYLNNLNAMHVAEKVLRNQFTTLEETYWHNLSHVQPHPSTPPPRNAPRLSSARLENV